MPDSLNRRKLPGVLYGAREPVMDALPQRVLHDLGRPDSESAYLWNQIYLRATPRVSLSDLLALPQLWGSLLDPVEDQLEPYFWGFNLAGRRLPQLEEALAEQDEPGQATEVDLFLLGASELVLIEAKANSGLGRCSRYASGRCPEVHREEREPPSEGCRYWELDAARFDRWMELGARPAPSSGAPACDRHYQLARTLLLGENLAVRLERRLHLWLLIPQRRWRQLQPTWLDFADRVRSPKVWRCLRVVSWESLSELPA